MNRAIPITFKNVSVVIFFFLLTIGFNYLVADTGQLKEEAVEREVVAKHTKKGLYLYPRFEIYVEGKENSSMISKEEFESINIGDRVTGYIRGEETFMTDKDIQVELMIGSPILVFMYIVLIFLTLAMVNSTDFVKRRKKLSTYLLTTIDFLIKMLFVIYLLAGLIMLSLVAVNAFHKVNKFNLTEAEAIVLGGDWERTRSHRGGAYTKYELFLLYKDDNNEMHISKKAVTKATYIAYDQGESIPIYYRNNNVYDTFVQAQSMKEVWPAFVNLITILLGIYVGSIIAIVRKWIKKRKREEEEQSEVVAAHN